MKLIFICKLLSYGQLFPPSCCIVKERRREGSQKIRKSGWIFQFVLLDVLRLLTCIVIQTVPYDTLKDTTRDPFQLLSKLSDTFFSVKFSFLNYPDFKFCLKNAQNSKVSIFRKKIVGSCYGKKSSWNSQYMGIFWQKIFLLQTVCLIWTINILHEVRKVH